MIKLKLTTQQVQHLMDLIGLSKGNNKTAIRLVNLFIRLGFKGKYDVFEKYNIRDCNAAAPIKLRLNQEQLQYLRTFVGNSFCNPGISYNIYDCISSNDFTKMLWSTDFFSKLIISYLE